MRYSIRRISPLGALLYGLLLGLGVWLIPGALAGWLVRSAVVNLRQWMSSLQVVIPLPIGDGITIDMAQALSLGETQARLAALAGQDVALVVAIALGTAAAGMLLTGLAALLSALLYNLFAAVFGGLELRLDALDTPAQRVVTAPPAARAAPAEPAAVAAPRPRVDVPRPARQAATAWLSAAGNESERRALRGDVTRIGSAPDNDIVLPGLAPQHAEIRRESGRYLIYDLGTRRTWVNDAQVAAVHMLKDGFRLQLGQAEFVVHVPANHQIIAEGR